jgi:hypothetical protein
MVVRAIVEQRFWKELNRKTEADGSAVPVDEIVSQLEAAIKHKAVDHKLPEPSRRTHTLALDATRLPWVGFGYVSFMPRPSDSVLRKISVVP